MTGQQEQPLRFIHSTWLHWKVVVYSVKENVKRRQFLRGERDRKREREERVRGRRRRRERERNSFRCITIRSLFHHMPLVDSFNTNTFVFPP